MLNGIDHIVIVVENLDTAIANYQQLGFTVVPGGRHPSIGTHNALIAFQDGAYVELIAFYQPNPQQRWWTLLQQGGGLIDFCLQTSDLDTDIAAFRAAGIAMTDRMPLSRERPDGYKLDWVLSVHTGAQQGMVPFLIEDITPRDERIPRQHTHANQVTGIDTLTVAVRDVATVSGWYAGVLGQPGEAITRDDLAAAGVRFTIGPHHFEFVAPTGSSGALHDWLETRGPSPFAAAFRTAGGKTGPLDHALALNARLRLI